MILVSVVLMARNITNSGCELYVQRRSEHGELNNLLEFPGGKIEVDQDESPREAAIREWSEEVGGPVLQEELSYLLGMYQHQYASREVMIYPHVFHAKGLVFDKDALWHSFSWDKDYDKNLFPAASHAIIDDLLTMLQRQDQKSLELLWPKLKS